MLPGGFFFFNPYQMYSRQVLSPMFNPSPSSPFSGFYFVEVYLNTEAQIQGGFTILPETKGQTVPILPPTNQYYLCYTRGF